MNANNIQVERQKVDGWWLLVRAPYLGNIKRSDNSIIYKETMVHIFIPQQNKTNGFLDDHYHEFK